MTDSVTITRATLDHLDMLVPLFDGYRQFYKKPTDPEGAREFLRERLANNESVVFIALLDGLGAGFTQLYPLFTSVSMKRFWLLNDLFVAPDARQKRIGEMLLERAKQHAIETGAHGMMLETAVDNFTAQRLYERMGWIRETEFYVYNILT